MNICLVTLPSPFLTDEKVFPQLGVLYIGASLKKKGHHVYVHDKPIESIPTGYDVYGISSTTPQFPYAVQALYLIRKINPKARVIIGGPHATHDTESCLENGFDSVVKNDGEDSVFKAIEENEKVFEGAVLDYIHPDRSLVDLDCYEYKIDGQPVTSIVTSRGCPFKCSFCANAGNYKLMPAEFVLEELRGIRDLGYNAFMFFDDLFVFNRKRLEEICAQMEQWGSLWRGFVRGDVILAHGEDTVKMMRDSGCREVGIGIESGSDRILKTINKKETSEQIRNAIRILQRNNIRVKGFLIVGLPGENWNSVKETMSFLNSVQLDDVDFTIFQPYKGSMIYENKEKFDIFWDEIDLKESWYKGKSNSYKSNVWTSALTKEDIVDIRNNFEKEFKPKGKKEQWCVLTE